MCSLFCFANEENSDNSPTNKNEAKTVLRNYCISRNLSIIPKSITALLVQATVPSKFLASADLPI